MPDYKTKLKDARLYFVTGQELSNGRSTPNVVEEALKGGAEIVQLRENFLADFELLKMAKQVRELTRSFKALFIVNNRPDIARLSEADGVHVGQDDLPVSEARKILGEEKIIGVSTHGLDQAKKALAEGADYLGVGPVYSTPTKAGRPAVGVEYVRQVADWNPPIPFFAIGGINVSNIEAVLAAGAQRVSVVRAIMGSKDPQKAAFELKTALNNKRVL